MLFYLGFYNSLRKWDKRLIWWGRYTGFLMFFFRTSHAGCVFSPSLLISLASFNSFPPLKVTILICPLGFAHDVSEMFWQAKKTRLVVVALERYESLTFFMQAYKTHVGCSLSKFFISVKILVIKILVLLGLSHNEIIH